MDTDNYLHITDIWLMGIWLIAGSKSLVSSSPFPDLNSIYIWAQSQTFHELRILCLHLLSGYSEHEWGGRTAETLAQHCFKIFSVIYLHPSLLRPNLVLPDNQYLVAEIFRKLLDFPDLFSVLDIFSFQTLHLIWTELWKYKTATEEVMKCKAGLIWTMSLFTMGLCSIK